MKVVYLSSSKIPSRSANSIHVMKMCQAIARNGHEVILLAQDDKKTAEPGVKDLYDYYGVEDCFEIIKLPWIRAIGQHAIYALLATLKAIHIKPDVIYCRNNPGFFFTVILRQSVIFEVHAPFATKGRYFDRLISRLIKSSAVLKIVVITNSLRQDFEKKYPSAAPKLIVAPDGADPFPSNIKQVTLPNSGGRLNVGYVGHLYAGKGIEIVSRIAAHCSWANFHIVGGTVEDLAYWEKKSGGYNNITFYGHVSNSSVASYLKAFDVVLLPNQTKVATYGGGGDIGGWTSPLKAFEYMAAAKPILCSDLPVLREIFEHDRNALLSRPDDIEEWISRLISLRDDRELRKRIGRAAREDFLNRYTWSIRSKKILKNIF